MVSGSNRGSRYEITSAEDVVIGRSVGCSVRLDDSEVSRQHAKIAHDGRDFLLRDLKSANGTKVNGQLKSERLLCNGDNLQFGSSVVAFQLAETSPRPHESLNQVRFIEDSRLLDDSAFAQTVGVDAGGASPVQGDPHSGLELLYRVAEELVTPVHTLESLLQRILDLTLQTVRADRHCVQTGHH